VAAPSGADIDLIATQGFALITRDRLEAADAELARFALPADLTIEQARQHIANLAPTALVDLNHVYRPEEFSCGGDTCAAFEAIGWRGSAHACPPGVVIGMIDTQVNTEHAALEAVDIEALPAIAGDRQPASAVHGTAVAILMAGRYDSRTPGLLRGASIVAAESFHRDRAGADAADAYDIARGIDMLARRGIGVINLSFTGPDNAILKQVVDVAISRDVILVAAAGNAGPNADPLYPAAYDGVVAVTAVDHRNRVYRHANAGDHIDFAAPGVRLWTAASVRGGRFRSGTSYASPFVAAALAAARAQWPEADSDALVNRLAEGVIDLGPAGRDPTFGWGLIQATEICPAGSGPISAGG
jgi:subtilisin family serine protease